MKFYRQHRLLCLSILAYLAGICLAALIWFTPHGASAARGIKSPAFQPSDGWEVCEDLGVGPVPGLSWYDYRQRFRLCHPDGWEYLAFCLEPGVPIPPMGSTCSEMTDGLFSCGENVQHLRLYAVVVTPTPRPTRTVTPTATVTLTVTPTRRVERPPKQPPEDTCEPPEVCNPTPRPRPGGSGNRPWLGLLVFSAAGLVLLQGSLWVKARRKS